MMKRLMTQNLNFFLFSTSLLTHQKLNKGVFEREMPPILNPKSILFVKLQSKAAIQNMNTSN